MDRTVLPSPRVAALTRLVGEGGAGGDPGKRSFELPDVVGDMTGLVSLRNRPRCCFG